MKKLYFISLILLINITIYVNAQNSSLYGGKFENKNSVYGDAGYGIVNLAVILRFNYERQIFKKNAIALMGRTGLGFWIDWTAYGLEIPLTVQTLFFKSASHLEIGIGFDWYTNIADSESAIPLIINFGYRYQNPDKGFIFRLNAEYNGNHLIPLVSFGKAF